MLQACFILYLHTEDECLPHRVYVVSRRRLVPSVKSWKISLVDLLWNSALKTGTWTQAPYKWSLRASPLPAAGLGFRAQALGWRLGVHSQFGPVCVLEMSYSRMFWELPQMPGDSASKKTHERTAVTSSTARCKVCVLFGNVTFWCSERNYFSKNTQAVEKQFLLKWKVCINIYKINCVHVWVYVYFKSWQMKTVLFSQLCCTCSLRYIPGTGEGMSLVCDTRQQIIQHANRMRKG